MTSQGFWRQSSPPPAPAPCWPGPLGGLGRHGADGGGALQPRWLGGEPALSRVCSVSLAHAPCPSASRVSSLRVHPRPCAGQRVSLWPSLSVCPSPRASLGWRVCVAVRMCGACLTSSLFPSLIHLSLTSDASLHVTKILLTEMKACPCKNLCTDVHNNPLHGGQNVEMHVSISWRRNRQTVVRPTAECRSALLQHERPSKIVD